ncbi:MAG: hypothetical protein KF910_05705 [Brevundimonas sp.]|uniref:WcbI family polysaccharide biosynthesis putative acetyltransferase n=1 Tax=Brevundimonas sp. TaxID=1871086 RepID=UPI0025BAAC65|nr:WcbI family polysaccharide biosynthesis putative acetyltransferase [Brevundimonas sp.]MBX3477080.1 hypothetical protein [Brevundimonas sp.]
MRIGVLGNCQAAGLGAWLQAGSPGIETCVHIVNRFDFRDPAVVAGVVAELAACDRVLIQNMGETQPALTALVHGARDAVGDGGLLWPVISFDGLHPDCVYVLRDDAPIDGAMGPYHSALACAAWQEGLAPARALGLFNAFAYAALGYFDAFDSAAARLLDRAGRLGFDLGSLVTPPGVFMHTVNHPTIHALAPVAEQALDRLGLARVARPTPPPDTLAASAIWPVYPEIARRLDLSAAALDLAALVAAEYAALDRDRDARGPFDYAETTPAVARARAFIRERLIR